MSRIGKKIIPITKGVKVKFEHGQCLVEGPKGKLSLNIPKGIGLEINNETILVKKEKEDKQYNVLHGTIRALVNNMVKGVSEGFRKELTIIGVGYKAQIKGKSLQLNLGFSHSVEVPIPQDLKVATPTPVNINIEGSDKQKVGEFAAVVRRLKPPEPYQGKGIRYLNEEVRKKLGKALAK